MGRTLIHAGRDGRVWMVESRGAAGAVRGAVARGVVAMKTAPLSRIARGRGRKGGVFRTARIAGILAAKRADPRIPLRPHSRSRTPRSTCPCGGGRRAPGQRSRRGPGRALSSR